MEISDEYIEKSDIRYEEYLDNMVSMFNIIDQVFFDGKLKRNLYMNASDMQINNDYLKKCLLTYRDQLKLFKNTGDLLILKKIIDKMSWYIIINSISQSSQLMLVHKLNLRWSLLDYFDDERKIGEKMMDVKNQLRLHINLPKEKDWEFNDDKEFNYAVGQLVKYFVYLSKSSKKTHVFINQYLNCKDIEQLKQKLIQMYKKYNYAIDFYLESRCSKLVEHIMRYDTNNILCEFIVAGFNGPLLILEKNKEEDEDE